MKKFLILLCAVAASATAFAQSAKVVVTTGGEVVGRYVKTNANTYTVEGQDDCTVPKAGHKVVVFSAENGQGVLTCKKPGSVNVRSIPSTSGNIVGKMVYEAGEIPWACPCLGKKDGWYKVQLENAVGYVRQDLVDWDPIDTF